jgi:hypothetical protein
VSSHGTKVSLAPDAAWEPSQEAGWHSSLAPVDRVHRRHPRRRAQRRLNRHQTYRDPSGGDQPHHCPLPPRPSTLGGQLAPAGRWLRVCLSRVGGRAKPGRR